MINYYASFYLFITRLISKPFYYLPIFLFFNQISYWYVWVVSFFLIAFLYYKYFSIINHSRCIIEWNEFEKVFINNETKRFELIKINSIKFEEHTILNYKDVAEKLALAGGYTQSQLDTFNKNPVRGFFAKRITKSILTSNKAYSFYIGPFSKYIVILRQTSLPSSLFEKFLIFHEISHIDFKGVDRQRDYNQEKFSLFLNIWYLFFLVLQTQQYIFFIIYLFFSLHYIYSILKNRGETYADLAGLAKLNDNKERLSVLSILIRYYEGQEKKHNRALADWLKRKEYAFRRSQLALVNNILTTGLFHDSTIYSKNKYVQIAKENHKFIIDQMRNMDGEPSFDYMVNIISGGQVGYTTIMIILNIYFIYSFAAISIYSPFVFIVVLFALALISIITWRIVVKKCFVILGKLATID